MKVHLLRHTKPDIAEGTCYGQSDIGLANTFSEELGQIRNKVSLIGFDSIFSSPLQRCLSLAKTLCPEHMGLIIDNRLKEMDFGAWEMMKWKDIYKSKEAQKWFGDYIHVRCPNGESFMDLYNRSKEFLYMLKNQLKVKDPLIVTHAGVIRAIYSIVEPKGLETSFDMNIGYGELKTFQL